MRLTIAQFAAFAADWKSHRLTDDDLRALELLLIDNPNCGQPIRATGGIRKLRFAPPSRHTGKSGAFRVCYVHFPTRSHVVLVALIAKNEQDNLTAAERTRLSKAVKRYDELL